MLKNKMITLLILFAGILIIPASNYYTYLSVKKIEHSAYCKVKHADECAGHEYNCFMSCRYNTVFVAYVQYIKKIKTIPIAQFKKQNWYYKDLKPQLVYFYRWVPPQII